MTTFTAEHHSASRVTNPGQPRHCWLIVATACAAILSSAARGAEPEAGLPLVLFDDFESTAAASAWAPGDPAAWRVDSRNGSRVFSLFQQSKVQTPFRSPFNWALRRDICVGDFQFDVDVQATARDYPHRDVCLFFGYQGPAEFYYVHLGQRTDDACNQIFLVNNANRAKISTRTTPGTPWDGGWHHVRVCRDVASGEIAVYFDDLANPVMTATDRTFSWGAIGVGAFDDTGNFDNVRLLGRTVAPPRPETSLLYVDFKQGLENQGQAQGALRLHGGPANDHDGRLEFTSAQQSAVLDGAGTSRLSTALAGCDSLTVGGWFLTRGMREQNIFGRGEMTVGPLGQRMFPPDPQFINFCLGTDHRGFLMGTVHGNGSLPFPHVTTNDVPVLVWQQLATVKTADGRHEFFQNGTRVHSDREAFWKPAVATWRESASGAVQPVHLRMPAGGLVGEVWIVGHALGPAEIAVDYQSKRDRYRPAPRGVAVPLREMASHPRAVHPVDGTPTGRSRLEIQQRMLKIFGNFPQTIEPLSPETISEEDCGSYLRRKVSFQVESDDRMIAYLLVPKKLEKPAPAIICIYGTTSGAGKLTTVGLSGRKPGDPPHANLSFALDVVEAGFVAFAADYLRDGERIVAGDAPYNTNRFYERHPDWSIHGKDAWDNMRAVDYLQSLDFVDGDRIGMMGHSYGGHSTIFSAAFEPRIHAAVANGPVSAFWEQGLHWAVPKGAGNSQSLPALRPFILDNEYDLPVTFAEITSLLAPRPLLIGQAAGEHRPIEEENCGFVYDAYRAAGEAGRVRYMWYAGDHDFPPVARAAAMQWFHKWFREPARPAETSRTGS